jgi:hypothetical protein
MAQQKVQQQTRTLSKEAEAARQKLKEMRAAKQNKGTATDSGQPAIKPQSHHSLNDAIPTKYKRLAPKRKDTPNP